MAQTKTPSEVSVKRFASSLRFAPTNTDRFASGMLFQVCMTPLIVAGWIQFQRSTVFDRLPVGNMSLKLTPEGVQGLVAR